MSEFISEMAKNDIVRCAVEWYEAQLAYIPNDPIPDAILDNTHGYLMDAVRRWKEAQA